MREIRKAVISGLVLMMSAVPVSAYQNIDSKRPVSLTIDGYPAENAEFSIYKVADFTVDIHFSVNEPYASAGIEISEDSYSEAALTLAAYVSSEKITADGKAVIIEGKAAFADLSQGLYLVVAEDVTADKKVYRETPALVALPGSADGVEWEYDVHMTPKYTVEEITQREVEYSVVKHWIDNNKDKRPAAIEVVLMKNNEAVETVKLNAANNWHYAWKSLDDGSTWSVMEKNVPENYRVKITGSRTEFVVNNSYVPDLPPSSPPTGDKQNLILPIILMVGAGMLILFMGILLRKKK